MKRYTFIILAALLGMLSKPIQAQQKNDQNALYIFRNDGGFNAFFFADIQRIDYSRVDTLGVRQDDYVVQEIYALDSVFRIPISAIDSVSFVTPKNVLKKDVICPDRTLTDYIIASDSTSWFRLSLSTPEGIIPKVGDKILIEEPVAFLPDGFSGKVTHVTQEDEGYLVETDAVAILDLYDRFIVKTSAGAPDNSNARSRRIGGELLDDEYNFKEPIELPTFSGTFSMADIQGEGFKAFNDNFSVSLEGSLSGSYSLTPKITELSVFLYADAAQGVKYYQYMKEHRTEKISFNATGQLGATLDIPYTVGKDLVKNFVKKLTNVEVDVSYGMFLRGQVVMNGGITHEKQGDGLTTVHYAEPLAHKPVSSDFFYKSVFNHNYDTCYAEGWAHNFNFTFGAYGKASWKIPFLKRVFEAEIRLEAGVRLEEDLPSLISILSTTPMLETGKIYSVLNTEDKVTLSLVAGGSFVVKMGVLFDLNYAPINLSGEFSLAKKGLFGAVPNMKDISWEVDKKAPWRGTFTTPLERELLFPKQIGFNILDISEDENKPVQAVDWWRSYSYTTNKYAKNLTYDCEDLEPGKFYKAFPQLKLFGYPVLADKNERVSLGPPSIKITPKKAEIIEGDDSYGIKKFEVITNIKNTEIIAEPDWLNKIKPHWYFEQGELTLFASDLPEKENIRKGLAHVIGKDKDGKELLRDTITVTQLRPVLKATPNPVEFDPTGGTKKVTLESTMADVKATKDLSSINWDLPYSFEMKDNTITITTGANNTDHALSGLIRLEGATEGGHKINTTVSISQDAVPPAWQPAIEFTKSDFLLSPLSYKTRIAANSNFHATDVDGTMDYTTNGDDDHLWFSLSPKFYNTPDEEGIYTTLWNIEVEPNDWDIDRKATITLVYKDQTGETTARGTITILQKSSKTLITLKKPVNLHSSGNRQFMEFELALPGSIEAKAIDSWLKVFQDTDTSLELHGEKNAAGEVRTGGIEVKVFDGNNNFIGVDTFYVTQSVVNMDFLEYIQKMEVHFSGMKALTDHQYVPVYSDDGESLLGYKPTNHEFNWNLNMSFGSVSSGNYINAKRQGGTLHVEAVSKCDLGEVLGITEHPYVYLTQWPHTYEHDILTTKVNAKLSFDITDLVSSVNNLNRVKIDNVRLIIESLDHEKDQYFPHVIEARAGGMAFANNDFPTWELGNILRWKSNYGSLSDHHTELIEEKAERYSNGKKVVYVVGENKVFDDSYSGLDVYIQIERFSPAVFGEARKMDTNRAAKAARKTMKATFNIENLK